MVIVNCASRRSITRRKFAVTSSGAGRNAAEWARPTAADPPRVASPAVPAPRPTAIRFHPRPPVTTGSSRRPYGGTSSPPGRAAGIPEIPATPDVVAEDPLSGFCGAAVACTSTAVTLEDRPAGGGTSR